MAGTSFAGLTLQVPVESVSSGWRRTANKTLVAGDLQELAQGDCAVVAGLLCSLRWYYQIVAHI